MNKIPTAKEFIKKYNEEYDTAYSVYGAIEEFMVDFARLHVNAALKAALESIPCLGSSTDIATFEEVEREILNAYPKNLIV
jgi:hypothetical protein